MICSLCHQEKPGSMACKVCGDPFCVDCCFAHEQSCGMYEKASGPLELRPYQDECVARILEELLGEIDS
jgi:hypothetical protein